MKNLCKEIEIDLGSTATPGRVGDFLASWADIENRILTAARERKDRVFSIRDALGILLGKGRIPSSLFRRLDAIRKLRNQAVHQPSEVDGRKLAEATEELRFLMTELKSLEL